MDGVFLVPFAPFLFVLGIIWLTNQRKLEEKRIAASAGRESTEGETRNAERIEELEERLRVLERIVTDKGYDVATQIEALRDQRRLKAQTEERAGAQ
jgi:hypothetical protein